MAHQSLYRKYRPQHFSDIVGQSHVTRTLANAVDEDVVAHAYLFTGPRGTGKTTTARILAKALDCEKGPTSQFDDTCQDCIDITEGRHPDVYELDAASRTGVDAVREEIINKVGYAATRGRWKVYIVDEVHMLSTSAFNALLKTLEEPPSRTVFVLCTTHPHKVPETILSRCQRFDFRRIGMDDIVETLAQIAKAENISVAEGSLTLIAKHAAGGMRDAISTLDQLASFSGRSITLEDVEGLLGEVDTALLFEVADLVLQRDVAGAFRFVADLAEAGIDVPEFVKSMTGHFRDLFVVAAVSDGEGIVDSTEDDLARLRSQAGEFGGDRIARILDLLGSLSAEIRWAGDARLALEVALVRMARPDGDITLEALNERLNALESGAPSTEPLRTAGEDRPRDVSEARKPVAKTREAKVPGSRQEAAPSPPVEESPASEPIPAEAREGDLDRARVKRAWPAIVAEVKKKRSSRAQLLTVTEVDVDGDAVVVEFPKDQRMSMQLAQDPATVQLLRDAIGRVLGVKPALRYQLGRGAVRPVQPADAPAPGQPSEGQGAAPGDRGDAPTAAPDAGTPAEPGTSRRDVDEDVSPEKMLIDELGAEVIVEHRHDSK